MPDEPEVLGLLALMLLHDSRRDARVAPTGELVLLEDQDRSLWDDGRDRRGPRAASSARSGAARPGPYQLQAAIAACTRRGDGETDWPQIVALYDELAGAAARRRSSS